MKYILQSIVNSGLIPIWFRKPFRRVQNFFRPAQETQPTPIINSEIINSFSQYGEDLVIDGIFGNKSEGFFIDIGANDPLIFNNTKRFYDKGWSGINIEPNPLLYKRITEQRIRDINLNIGVGQINQKIPFYLISADTLSSFNKDDAERNCSNFNEKIINVITIPMVTLTEIIASYAKGRSIDILSIDVEGYEMEVIKGNDWTQYRPKLILIELGFNTDTFEIFTFLRENGYELVFRNHVNGIFINIRSLPL